MKGLKLKKRIRRKYVYFSIILSLILYFTFSSKLGSYKNDIPNTIKTEKKEEDPMIINEDEKFQLDNKLVNLLLNDTIKIKNGNEKINSMVKKMILDMMEKPLAADDFEELRKREEFHTTLWNMEFGQLNLKEDPTELTKYKRKLLEESSFLSQKHKNDLDGNKKTLSILHQSLYPWLYGYRYHSFSDIISSSNGRGIVLCTGNHHFKYARSTIDIIRHILNSELPIEVFYYGEADLSTRNREILKGYENVYLSDITTYFDNSIVDISSWAIKPFSILASRFEEVILMDADALYLRDPIELFKERGYQEKGTLFFRDRTLFPGANAASKWLKSWMVNPLPETQELRFWKERTEHEMDSSTVVIHKTKTILGLLNVCKLNERVIRQDVVYRKVYGDKETFWIGFDMARQPYYMSKKPCAFAGEIVDESSSSNSEDKKLCGHTAHTLENGKLIFWNGHLIKDKNIGMYANELIKFEAYTLEDNDKDWSINLACLDLHENSKLNYFDEEELRVYNEIMKRENDQHFVATEIKKRKKNRTSKVLNENEKNEKK